MNKYKDLVEQLAEEGWATYPDFISPELVISLREELTLLYDNGEFREAGIGKGNNFQVRPEIRSDRVLWLDAQNLSKLQKSYWNKINDLRLLFNKEFYLGLKSFEAHFTKYPPGSFYKRHIDQFQQVPYRIISCLLYLNPDWKASYGGQLRIYLPHKNGGEKSVDIIPMAGTLAVFKSAEIPHEVLVTEKQRFSITGWMRNID
jgi:SM-20-related protein